MIAEMERARHFAKALLLALPESSSLEEALEATEIALAVQLGMVGDEWHGPTAPGPGWVQTGQGERGGKVWKKAGGGGKTKASARKKPSQYAANALTSTEIRWARANGHLESANDLVDQEKVDFIKSQAGVASQPVQSQQQPTGTPIVQRPDDLLAGVLIRSGLDLQSDEGQQAYTLMEELKAKGRLAATQEEANALVEEFATAVSRLKNTILQQYIQGQFSHDIFSPKAQKILDKALAEMKKFSRAAYADLKRALDAPSLVEVGQQLVEFIRFYRVRLAEILGRAALASLLEGAVQIAESLPMVPVASPTPVTPIVLRPPSLPIIETPATAPMAPPISFVPLHPEEDVFFPVIDEAVRTLQEKQVLDKWSYDLLDQATKQKYFTVAGVESRETLEKIRDALVEGIEGKLDLPAFQERVLETLDTGTFLSDARMETLYRDTINAGYSDGQMKVLSHPYVRNGFPYIQYSAIEDSRVRKEHLAMEKHGIQGTAIYRSNDPVIRKFLPPWSYNCRCSWWPITIRQASEHGIDEAKAWLATGIEPSPPAFVMMPPFEPPPEFQRDLSSLPLSIQLAITPIDDWMGVGLGMVGDEWHGPEAPGPGWVQAGEGERGGKVWKKQGGAAGKAKAAPRFALKAAAKTVEKALLKQDVDTALATIAQLTPEQQQAVLATLSPRNQETLRWFKANAAAASGEEEPQQAAQQAPPPSPRPGEPGAPPIEKPVVMEEIFANEQEATRQDVLTAAKAVEKDLANRPVSFKEFYPYISPEKRKAVDRTLFEMADRGEIILHRHDHPGQLTAEERSQLLYDPGSQTYFTLFAFTEQGGLSLALEGVQPRGADGRFVPVSRPPLAVGDVRYQSEPPGPGWTYEGDGCWSYRGDGEDHTIALLEKEIGELDPAALGLLDGVGFAWRPTGTTAHGGKKGWYNQETGETRYQEIQPGTRAKGRQKKQLSQPPQIAAAPAAKPQGGQQQSQAAPKQPARPEAKPQSQPPPLAPEQQQRFKQLQQEAQRDASDPNNAINRLKGQMAELKTGAGPSIQTIRSTQDSPLTAQDHEQVAAFHARIGGMLQAMGNKELAQANFEASRLHRQAGQARTARANKESAARGIPSDEQFADQNVSFFGEGAKGINQSGKITQGGKDYFYKGGLEEKAAKKELLAYQFGKLAGINTLEARSAELGKYDSNYAQGNGEIVANWIEGETAGTFIGRKRDEAAARGEPYYDVLPESIPINEIDRNIFYSFLISDDDRHMGNYMLSNGKLVSIDHGLAFDDYSYEGQSVEAIIRGEGLGNYRGFDPVTRDNIPWSREEAGKLAAKAPEMEKALRAAGLDTTADRLELRGRILKNFSQSATGDENDLRNALAQESRPR